MGFSLKFYVLLYIKMNIKKEKGMQSIAVFNNKGGVGKTTLVCNLAAYIQKRLGKKILVIDADPQCNTTTYVLNEDQFMNVYYEPKEFTIAEIVPPLENGEGYIQKFDVTKSMHFEFDLLPGNPKFAACEDFLASEWKDVKSSDLRGIKSTMLFVHFMKLCSDYDYVFYDMGPSLGAINRSILLACDYFITPMSTDVFSLLALENIGESIKTWGRMFNKGIEGMDETKRTSIAGLKTSCDIKFLGYVEQQYIMKTVGETKRAVHAYEEILRKIPNEIHQRVVIPINGEEKDNIEYKIGSIPNFYSLVPMSQTAHKPIFDLTNADGVVGAHYQKVKDYEGLMQKITEDIMNNMGIIK